MAIVQGVVAVSLVTVGCAPSQPIPSVPSVPTPAFVATATPQATPLLTQSPSTAATSATSTPAAGPPNGTPNPAVAQPRYGGLLTVGLASNPASLDVQQENSLIVFTAIADAYDGLIGYDGATLSKISPALAEQWDISNDGMTYTFTLRKGVMFHNGAPLTQEDVLFTLERNMQPPKGVTSNMGYALADVAKVTPKGNDSLVVALKRPFAPLLSILAHPSLAVYPKAVVEAKGNMKTTVVGTGPFRLKSYTPGVSLNLERNDGYYVKGRPYLDGVAFPIVPDAATRLAALRTGRIRLTQRTFGVLSPSELAMVRKEVPNLQSWPDPSPLVPAISFNMRRAPFADVRVRKAVSLALDRRAAISVLAEGDGLPGKWFPIEGVGLTPAEMSRIPGYRQSKDADLADAKSLMAAAGYPNGVDLSFLTRTNAQQKNAVIFVSEEMKKLNIRAKVEVVEDAQYFDRARRSDFDAIVVGIVPVVPDVWAIGRFFLPGAAANFSGIDDPQLNSSWDRMLATGETAGRDAVVKGVETYLLEEVVPGVPVVWPRIYLAAWPDVHGFAPGINDNIANRYEDVWLAK